LASRRFSICAKKFDYLVILLMEIYIKIFEVIFPVFFVIGIGYYLGKKNPKFDTNFITNFAGNIGTPAMIFYTVTTTGITLDIFTNYFNDSRFCDYWFNITFYS
jgi:hypothetical protein